MSRLFACVLVVVSCALSGFPAVSQADPPSPSGGSAKADEASFLSNVRRVTFNGRRAGEGYFSADGSMMIFQSEREKTNPFYQIYVMDLETGDIDRVSPGHGKTTCAWIHPDGKRGLYASTHDDPESVAKQKAEFALRESGKERRYAWDYDEHFEIYVSGLDGKNIVNVTNARGYDAEGSFSPDGKLIAFTSNRHAYGPNADPMTEAEKKRFEIDKSLMLDLYIMNADGTNVKRLMNVKGYDGGPFFSPDGKRICWRRFNVKGDTAEIYTMNIDGTDVRRLTTLNAMSWAPYYHPSGEYLIFTTNRHGFSNFELYMVSKDGGTPVRVSTTDGFDGLPVFFPDGKRIGWTSTRHGAGRKAGQIYFADWNHEKARAALAAAKAEDVKRGSKGGSKAGGGQARAGDAPSGVPLAKVDLADTTAAVSFGDLEKHLRVLAGPDANGRVAGTTGARRAADYIAGVFKSLGLEPAGDNGTYFQTVRFSVTKGVAKDGNSLEVTSGVEMAFERKNWRPLAFSADTEGGPVEGEIAFAGYGLSAPAFASFPAYDSYGGLDVAGKWVVVLDGVPTRIDKAWRTHLLGYAARAHKAADLLDRGACGMVLVTSSGDGHSALPGETRAAMALPAVAIVEGSGLLRGRAEVADARKELDGGEPVPGFALQGGLKLSASIKLDREMRTCRNVLARLNAGAAPIASVIVVGAHYDGSGSTGMTAVVHPGADDNASGAAGVLEIAQWLSSMKARGRLKAKRDLLFACWTGGAAGLAGSDHFVNNAEGFGGEGEINPPFNAYLNLDRIGRLGANAMLEGVGSSAAWSSEIEKRNVPVGLPLKTSAACFLPTDATSFFLTGVPILSATTGHHPDVGTMNDAVGKVSLEGAAKVTKLMGLIARGLVTADDAPDFVQVNRAAAKRPSRGNVALGTMPDYAAEDVDGMKLQGVRDGSPAAKAGVKSGDIVVGLGGKTIGDIYGYMDALNALEAGKKTTIVVLRDGKRVTLEIVPERKE